MRQKEREVRSAAEVLLADREEVTGRGEMFPSAAYIGRGRTEGSGSFLGFSLSQPRNHIPVLWLLFWEMLLREKVRFGVCLELAVPQRCSLRRSPRCPALLEVLPPECR